MKKRNQKIYECQTSGKKILCGKFAQKMKSNYAVGDEDNNILLYNNLSPKPISFMNSQTSNVSSVTSLTFANEDSIIISGSNRGSLNAWDIQTSKISFCLKGHTIEITSMYTDKNNSNLIVTGSLDTNTKIWDLRSKNCLSTLKNHTKKVSALNMTPDSKIIISGGEDGVVQTWQLRMQRTIFQYQIGSTVLSIDSNSQNMMAVGSMDRLARVFQISAPFMLYGQTKNQTMPINSCIFYKQFFLFTSGTDNLKLWDVQQDIFLTDNIQTSSKGILHMTLSQKVQQIAYTGGSLSYHECLFNDINFIKGLQSPTIKYDFRQQFFEPTNKNLSTLKKGKSYNQPIEKYITNQKIKQMIANRSSIMNSTIAKNLSDVNYEINDVLANIKKVSENFSNSKKQIAQIDSLMGPEHSKFMKIMSFRAKSMQYFLQHWSKGNFKILIQQLKTIDIYVASDALKEILASSKYQISAEFALVICQRSKQMIFSKHNTLVKNGITYLLKIVNSFKDQMIKLKVFGCDKGVDLARQERLRRFDQMIEIFVQVYQSGRMKKIINKNDQLSSLASQLQKQLTEIFNRVFGKSSQL